MNIKRELSNNPTIEEIVNGYIVRYCIVEVQDDYEDDYNYRDVAQYFTDVEDALQAIKQFYNLALFKR